MEFLFTPAQHLLPDTPWLLPLFFALFGACIGSFLNVVIYRMPLGLSVNEPRRSFCPTCKAPIPWYLNLPVISYLMLRGRSACCHTRITLRYCLVELCCALLWASLAYTYDTETLPVLIALCCWFSLMLASFCMDWEKMAVFPSLTLAAGLCGLLTAYLAPWLVEEGALEAWEGLQTSLLGAFGGFALFKLVALVGKVLFGRRRNDFGQDCTWHLGQAADGEDIELRMGEHTLLWSDIFLEEGNRLTLTEAVESTHDAPPAELVLTADALQLPDGSRIPLESVEALHGRCKGYTWTREAMGSGDAWLALAIGALCGWQGIVFSLVGGSFLGLAMAAVNRVGFGKPMPFGPALIAAAALWLFFGADLIGFYNGFWGL